VANASMHAFADREGLRSVDTVDAEQPNLDLAHREEKQSKATRAINQNKLSAKPLTAVKLPL
jgi:hypothetical protein